MKVKLAKAQIGLGQRDAARATLDAILKNDPDHPEAKRCGNNSASRPVNKHLRRPHRCARRPQAAQELLGLPAETCFCLGPGHDETHRFFSFVNGVVAFCIFSTFHVRHRRRRYTIRKRPRHEGDGARL